MKPLSSLAVLFLLSFSSCKKTEHCEKDDSHFTGNWRFTSFVVENGPQPVELMKSCNNDDVVTFNADHTYTWDDKTSVCSPSVSHSGTWELKNGLLYVDAVDYTITGFDCQTLLLSKMNYQGTTGKATIVVKRL